MNKFDVKNINFVGAAASLLAVIFSFIPFYTVKVSSAGKTLMSYTSSYASQMSASKMLLTYNFFGILFLLVSIAALGCYVLNNSKEITMIATCLSFASFIVLILAMIVGNSDVKEAKEFISMYGMSAYFKIGFSAGMVLELIVVIISIASYWINELVIKKYVFKVTTAPELNPFVAISKPSSSQGQYNGNAQGQYNNPQVQQPMQGQYNNPQMQYNNPQAQYNNPQVQQPMQGQYNNPQVQQPNNPNNMR